MQKRKLSVYILIISLLSTLLFNSCKKIDISSNAVLQKVETDGKFFIIPQGTDKVTIRIIEEIKKRNINKEFVKNFAVTNGYPVWDKVLFTGGSKSNNIQVGYSINQSTDFGSDTLAYIPIVLEGQHVVNGYILARINDTIQLSYTLSQDYKAYVNNSSTQETSTDFSLKIMLLNYKVFDHKSFDITDEKIFISGNISEVVKKVRITKINGINLSSNSIALENLQYSTATLSTYCFTYQKLHICSWCRGIDPNCPLGGTWTTTETFCVTYSEPVNNNGNGDGTGGGGGGGEIPHSYPCNPNITSPSILNVPNTVYPGDLPPCPAPGPGIGWTPTAYNPNNPCNVVDSLLKTTSFRQHLNRLRAATPSRPEIGVSFTLPDTSASTNTYYAGNGVLGVDIVLANPSDGIAHNHYDTSARLPIFSAEDIYELAYNYSINKIKDTKTFTYTLVTDSTSYILMIDDIVKFNSFITTWFDTKDHIDKFSNQLYINYNVGDSGLSNAENESNFLEGINAYPAGGAGLKLFKGNSDMSQFSPIKLNSSNQVRPDPCL